MRMKQQQGMTFYGTIIMLAVTAFMLYSAVVMILIHMDHLKITSTLEGLRTIPHVTQLSEEDVRAKLRTNLHNNNIYDEELNRYTGLFKIESESNELKVSIEYQVTYKLMFGYRLTKKFKDDVSIVTN